MIISRTPVRVSLCGGGTDFPEHYRQHGGAVLSTAIDRYIYVVVKRRFDDQIRVGYTKTEIVAGLDQIQHDLVREAMKLVGPGRGLEVVTLADVPSAGSGLGSSSALTVGLLNALYAHGGVVVSPQRLAEEACHIERNVLGRPIGVQDQYIAAYGGLRFITFGRCGRVAVEDVVVSHKTRRALEQNLLLFFTGIARRAETVLAEQVANTAQNTDLLAALSVLTAQAMECLTIDMPDELGTLLHKSWLLKKQLAETISSGPLDEIYETGLKAGAWGGKVTGAGGGGFMLFYCRPERQERLRAALRGLRELRFGFAPCGSQIVYQEGI